MMLSREIVKRAIQMEAPVRLPMDFPSCGFGDIMRVGPETRGKAGYRKDGWVMERDEWGCKWGVTPSTSGTFGHPVEFPLARWDDLKTYEFPDPFNPQRYEGLDDEIERAENRGQYIAYFSPFTLFERLHMLRGFENILLDLCLEPDRFRALAENVLKFHLGVIRTLDENFRGKIDAYYMTDDWGSQDTTLISLPMWRTFFKPLYKKLFDAIHEAGMHAYLHSCGKINDLFDDYIDIGLDVVNLRQPRLLGIEEIGKRFAGRICFTASLDCQKTLPTQDDGVMREEAVLLLRHWATEKGGFIPLEFLRPSSVNLDQEINWKSFFIFSELTGQFNRLKL
jgi:hypothetical protein